MVLDGVNVEFHADDYGMFLPQSRRILDCRSFGSLNGVSIMPNGEALAEAMELLKEQYPPVHVTLHMNLIEGRCLSVPAKGMTDETGIFKITFGSLLLRSYLPGRKKVFAWLKEELRAQIHAASACLPEGTPLRLDGHAHYHMIPVVFDAMMEVVREEGQKVSYIRIPREYPMLYLRHWRQLRDLAPINLVKVLILNLLSFRCRIKYRKALAAMDRKVFLGVFLSGRMYRDNVERILPDALAVARKKGWGLEVLAHPGGVEEPEDIRKLTNHEDVVFLTDSRRSEEAGMFQLGRDKKR